MKPDIASAPDLAAEVERLREALKRVADIYDRNAYRQWEKCDDIPHIARAALERAA